MYFCGKKNGSWGRREVRRKIGKDARLLTGREVGEGWELLIAVLDKMEIENRKNINRGYRKLLVWQESVQMYVYVSKVLLAKVPFELKKSVANALDSSMSIQRNITEGYCRKSIKEYLNFLNYSLGSCGELYTSMFSFKEANQIKMEDFEEFDKMHYSVENKLINLIKSLQKKNKDKDWEDSFR